MLKKQDQNDGLAGMKKVGTIFSFHLKTMFAHAPQAGFVVSKEKMLFWF